MLIYWVDRRYINRLILFNDIICFDNYFNLNSFEVLYMVFIRNFFCVGKDKIRKWREKF